MRQLEFNGTVIRYELVFSNRAKSMNARIRDGQVKITVPRGLAEKKAVAMIEAAKERVFKLWQQAVEAQKQSLSKRCEEGEYFPFLGETLYLMINKSRNKTIQVQRSEQNLVISLPTQGFSDNASEVIAGAIEAWYKAQAREILWNKLDHFAKIMEVEYRQFRLKDQKTRWGSCSAQGNINLNWRIILAPEAVVDYLVVHELAHLRHLNHSSDFWSVVETYLPHFRRLRGWLKEHGRELML